MPGVFVESDASKSPSPSQQRQQEAADTNEEDEAANQLIKIYKDYINDRESNKEEVAELFLEMIQTILECIEGDVRKAARYMDTITENLDGLFDHFESQS